jgi:hypothetical protein
VRWSRRASPRSRRAGGFRCEGFLRPPAPPLAQPQTGRPPPRPDGPVPPPGGTGPARPRCGPGRPYRGRLGTTVTVGHRQSRKAYDGRAELHRISQHRACERALAVSSLSAATPWPALHRTTTPRSAKGTGLRRCGGQRGREGRCEPAGLRSHRRGQGFESPQLHQAQRSVGSRRTRPPSADCQQNTASVISSTHRGDLCSRCSEPLPALLAARRLSRRPGVWLALG